MLPFHQIETLLQRIPSHLQDIVLELRNIVTEVAPDAVEDVLRAYLGRNAQAGNAGRAA